MPASAGVAASAFTPRRLVAGLGGDSAVTAFYDDWFKVSSSSGSVTGWADFRSALSSAWTSLINFTSGTKPTVASGIGSPIVFAAGGATLADANSGSTGIFSNGVQGTLILIGSSTYAGSASDGSLAPIIGINGASTDLYIAVNTTPQYRSNNGNVYGAVNSGIAAGSIIRAIISTISSTISGIQVALHAQQTTSCTSLANSSSTLVVGAASVGATSSHPLSVHAIIMMNGTAVSAVQAAYAALFGTLRHGAVISA